MKNLLTKAIGIAGITALSFLPMNGKGQVSSLKEHSQISKELDTLQDLAINNFNNAKTNYNSCVDEGGNSLCVYALVGGVSLSKKYLEQYVSLFEKNKTLEGNYANMKYGRDLSISESKEFIQNIDSLIGDVAEFIKNPSTEKQNKWQKALGSTINRANLYFPPEGVIDLSPVLGKE